jgi:hypothetical protein
MKTNKVKLFSRKKLSAMILGLVILIGNQVWAGPWKFGVMSDTQWKTSPDGKNVNTVATNVIDHLNQEFIKQGVKFVIQVGDLTENKTASEMDTTAAHRQALYNAGIGFFPLRGNHEDSIPAAKEFQIDFPQTQTGCTKTSLCMGSNFATLTNWEGLTYSFDYENARFVLMDQFISPVSGVPAHSNLNSTDVEWARSHLASRSTNSHAFSFAHKGLVTENHADNMFNSTNPTASQDSMNLMETFMMHLQTNGVRYHMGGHDHMHNRAMISSPNTGNYKVQNIITASNSYKFYIPPYQDKFNTQSAFRNLEKPLAQEIFPVGYYIFTVDGPKVTVDFYAMPNGCGGDCDLTYDVIPYEGNTPTSYAQPNGPGSTATTLLPTVVTYSNPVPFTKHETFGYSLNGIEKIVDQGAGYSLVDNTEKAITNGEKGYLGTTAAILSGTNGSTGKDYNLRPLAKSVNTGWAPASAELYSDIFTLWGMQDSLATKLTPINSTSPQYIDYSYFVPDTVKTDTYVLSMRFKDPRVNGKHRGNAGFRLAAKDENGHWVNAVALNSHGTPVFVPGPWKEGYGIGTHGVDMATGTAWAVIDHAGDFAVARDIDE